MKITFTVWTWLLKIPVKGLPWWSSGYDSTLPMQGAWVRSLVGELRSHIPCVVWPKKKIKNSCEAARLNIILTKYVRTNEDKIGLALLRLI